MSLLAEIGLGRPFDQVCVVVRDLDAAVRAYTDVLGLGPWMGWRYDGDLLRYRTYRGEPAHWSMRLALTEARGPQLELVEPGPGPSVFTSFLETRGPGLQHVAFFVPSFDAVHESLEERGHHAVQTGGGHGVHGDGRFGYFDLSDELGIVLEIVEAPRERPAPHFTYPGPKERPR